MPLPTQMSAPIGDPERLKVLIYGETATGKSTFCSRPDNVLIIPFDDTVKGISGYKYDTITDWKQLCQAQVELEAGGHGFKNVCIDNLGRALDLCKEHIRKTHRVEHESDIPGFAKGHSLIRNEFKRVLFSFIHLPMGVFFCCHAKVENIKTRSEEFRKIVPDLSPGPRDDVINQCDFVLYSYKEQVTIADSEEKRTLIWMLTKGDLYEYEGKDRFGWLPWKMKTSYPQFIEYCRKAAAANGGAQNVQGQQAQPGAQSQQAQQTQQTPQGQQGQAPKPEQVSKPDTASKPEVERPSVDITPPVEAVTQVPPPGSAATEKTATEKTATETRTQNATGISEPDKQEPNTEKAAATAATAKKNSKEVK